MGELVVEQCEKMVVNLFYAKGELLKMETVAIRVHVLLGSDQSAHGTPT
jgi:hypothetical protein